MEYKLFNSTKLEQQQKFINVLISNTVQYNIAPNKQIKQQKNTFLYLINLRISMYFISIFVQQQTNQFLQIIPMYLYLEPFQQILMQISYHILYHNISK